MLQCIDWKCAVQVSVCMSVIYCTWLLIEGASLSTIHISILCYSQEGLWGKDILQYLKTYNCAFHFPAMSMVTSISSAPLICASSRFQNLESVCHNVVSYGKVREDIGGYPYHRQMTRETSGWVHAPCIIFIQTADVYLTYSSMYIAKMGQGLLLFQTHIFWLAFHVLTALDSWVQRMCLCTLMADLKFQYT